MFVSCLQKGEVDSDAGGEDDDFGDEVRSDDEEEVGNDDANQGGGTLHQVRFRLAEWDPAIVKIRYVAMIKLELVLHACCLPVLAHYCVCFFTWCVNISVSVVLLLGGYLPTKK